MSPGVVAKDLIRPSHEHDARNRRDYESRIGALRRPGFCSRAYLRAIPVNPLALWKL